MPYRIFVPKDYSAKNSYPLVLWLHGAGGRGTDNLKQLTASGSGERSLGVTIWVKAENQAKNPCIVVAPQCPDNPDNKVWARADGFGTPFKVNPSPEEIRSRIKEYAAGVTYKPSEYLLATYELIKSLQKTLSIDPDRIYVIGASLGGAGTWAVVIAYPDRFALIPETKKKYEEYGTSYLIEFVSKES